MRGFNPGLLAPSCESCPPESVRKNYGAPPDPNDPFRPLPAVRERSPWKARAGGKLERTDQPFVAQIDRDGTIRFFDSPNVNVDAKRWGGSFDLTDAVMKSRGEELYSYRKMRIMESTRPEREKMAFRARKEALVNSVGALPRRLLKLWQRRDLSAAERRALIFQLWDECAEVGPSEVVAAARTARTRILAFIRRELPRDKNGFTDDELKRFNAKRSSKEKFDPYRESKPAAEG
jgi:hypothetical protein